MQNLSWALVKIGRALNEELGEDVFSAGGAALVDDDDSEEDDYGLNDYDDDYNSEDLEGFSESDY